MTRVTPRHPPVDGFVLPAGARRCVHMTKPRALALVLVAGALGALGALGACAPAAGDLTMGALLVDQPATVRQAIHEQCPAGGTTFGIDVSKYQGTIDWPGVAAAGVKFAFIRASDGTGFVDEYFDANWAGAAANGIRRGAYQFVRSNEDPIAQADLLLNMMGALAPGDLPPVMDMESTDGVDNATRVNEIRDWLAHVDAATGVTSIIYTGGYFWQDNVGTDEFNNHPLWHAGYTGGTCPSTIADQWPGWAVWQYTSTGAVGGISGDMDLDTFNGDERALTDFAVGVAVCGDGICSGGEDGASCAADCPVCEALPAAGGVVTEAGPCFLAGGPSQFLRHATDAGEGGGLIWTHTTSDAAEANFGTWAVRLSEAGHYKLEAYTDAAYAQSVQSVYLVHHAGADDVFTVDQTAVDGWNVIAADLEFDAQGERVHLGDNTGEAGATNTQQVYDAIRLTRIDVAEGEGEGDAAPQQQVVIQAPPAGCASSSASPAAALVVLLALLRRRRR